MTFEQRSDGERRVVRGGRIFQGNGDSTALGGSVMSREAGAVRQERMRGKDRR